MNRKHTDRDLRLLSAYLDGELKESQKRKLEQRLAEDTALRERLDNLRKTKSMLSWLPRVPAPRNFTLTPEMVTVRRKKRPLLLSLRWASSVAAILMVVLFSFELLSGNALLAGPSQKSAPVMDEASYAAETTPQPLILWGAPGVGGEAIGRGGGSGEGDLQANEEPMMEIAPPPEDEVGELPTPAEETVEEAQPAPMESEEESLDTARSDGDSPILGINTDQGGDVVTTSEDTPRNANLLANLSLIRWVEIILAIVAVGGGIAFLILRKR
ncbi:hypothetical protein KQH50_01920 [bacterium]|nr:hypothetical protein [bacterium]